MTFKRLNDSPDDNYRIYFKERETGRLYCWLAYGPPAAWAFYVCTSDGEPSHEVPPPPGIERPHA